MAHLPFDDAESLFRDNKAKSWAGLEQELQQRKGKAEGISDNLVGMLMPIVQKMIQSKQDYPDSPQDLQNVLNQQLMKVPETQPARS
jgi:hypothetical protein